MYNEDFDAVYAAELEFGHDFVQNNYELVLNSDIEELREIYEEYKRKEM